MNKDQMELASAERRNFLKLSASGAFTAATVRSASAAAASGAKDRANRQQATRITSSSDHPDKRHAIADAGRSEQQGEA